jgi:hypothetical protein
MCSLIFTMYLSNLPKEGHNNTIYLYTILPLIGKPFKIMIADSLKFFPPIHFSKEGWMISKRGPFNLCQN